MNTVTVNQHSEKLLMYVIGGLITIAVLSVAIFMQITLNQVFALFLEVTARTLANPPKSSSSIGSSR